ncbi:hypothetical protein P168DRAFT_304475, partial [Aspergillus campestris IBT 28561]
MLQGPLARGDQRLAVIGGFCVQHYLGNHDRETNDLDLMIDLDCPTDEIKIDLVEADPEKFQLRADILYYCSSTRLVQVDLISHQIALPYYRRMLANPLCEGLPAEAIRIGNTQVEHPPFLSVKDMVAIKVYYCGTRSTKEKNDQDARDAWELAARLPRGVTWEPWQHDAFRAGLDDAVYFSRRTRNAW